MTGRHLHDETLYCNRCGISFLWPREERERDSQGATVTPVRPDRCPGCRELLPSAERERGLVKWFDHRRRFGFLARAQGPDLFVHRSALAENTRLRPGDLVEFSVAETERGAIAAEVTLLMPGGALAKEPFDP